MTLSVVVPNWNGEKLLRKNLPQVFKIGAGEVIVVEDASTDNSLGVLQEFEKENACLNVVINKENLGFAKSVNKGVAIATGEIVMLLNTDVQPLPGLIKSVIPHFGDEKVFGVSLSERDFSWGRGMWRNGYVEHEPGVRENKTHETFWVSGGSGVIRKSIWDELEGFDESFAPFYWEDLDISYRAAKRGYKLLWDPKAQVLHEHEGTIGKYFPRSYINFIQERNQLIFIWKNITSHKMIKEHAFGLIHRVFNAPGYIRIVFAALKKLPEIIKSRKVETGKASVTDEQIFSRFK